MDGEWIADLTNMTCRDITNNIVVIFEKAGIGFRGKLKDIPMDLFAKWAAEPHGERRIQSAVMEAEEVFFKAYFESDIEKNVIRSELL